jgi:hypothetical protein
VTVVTALGTEPAGEPIPGVRVVLDVRPLQDPDRAPATSAYLAGLLGAYDAEPLEGESFAFLLQSDLDDPTTSFVGLEVVGRRLLPPTRFLRSGALTVDPFLLRGASLGAAWRADRGGAAGAVYHAAAGSPPLFSGLPIVVTLLDLAPWELAGAYQRTPSARFGQRLRARLLRDAAAVIVGTTAVARSVHRLLHVRRDRIRVVPLAARPAFGPAPDGGASRDPGPDAGPAAATDPGARHEIERLGLPDRYLVYPGRYDARQDFATLLAVSPRSAQPAGPARCPSTSRGRHAFSSSARPRATGRPSLVPPGGPASAMPWPTPRSCPRSGSRGSSGEPGPSSCRRSRKGRAWGPSRPSPAGPRSSPPASVPCLRSSAGRASSSSPATTTAWPPRFGPSGSTSGPIAASPATP